MQDLDDHPLRAVTTRQIPQLVGELRKREGGGHCQHPNLILVGVLQADLGRHDAGMASPLHQAGRVHADESNGSMPHTKASTHLGMAKREHQQKLRHPSRAGCNVRPFMTQTIPSSRRNLATLDPTSTLTPEAPLRLWCAPNLQHMARPKVMAYLLRCMGCQSHQHGRILRHNAVHPVMGPGTVHLVIQGSPWSVKAELWCCVQHLTRPAWPLA